MEPYGVAQVTFPDTQPYWVTASNYNVAFPVLCRVKLKKRPAITAGLFFDRW